MSDSSKQNALLCLCKKLNSELKQVDQSDLKQITPIIDSYSIQAAVIGFSRHRLVYTLGVINGKYLEYE